MKVAAVQFSLTPGDLVANTDKMLEYIRTAAHADGDLVVFPEMSDTGYDIPIIQKSAQSWDKGTVHQLCEAARVHKINIIAGVSEREAEQIFNSTVMIDRRGRISGRYRKTHLFRGEPVREHECFSPGNELDVVAVEGIESGVMTCYDIRFPEVARTLRNKGAQIIFVPAAFPLIRLPHWKALLAARAIENQVFIVAVNRIGTDGGVTFAGTTIIIDPYGTTLSSGSCISEGAIWAEVEPETVQRVRAQFANYQDRRPSIYTI